MNNYYSRFTSFIVVLFRLILCKELLFFHFIDLIRALAIILLAQWEQAREDDFERSRKNTWNFMQNEFHALNAHAVSLRHFNDDDVAVWFTHRKVLFVIASKSDAVLRATWFFSPQISFLGKKISSTPNSAHLNTEQEFPQSVNESANFFLFPELDHTFFLQFYLHFFFRRTWHN